MFQMWEAIDIAVYLILNGSVEQKGLWSEAAAFSNSKLYDKLSTLFLIIVLASYCIFGRNGGWKKRLAAVIFIGLYMLITTLFRRQLGLFEIGRESPSLTDLPFIDLREMHPNIAPKTTSGSSFPGDHGISCFILVAIFWYYAGWKWGTFSALVTPLFVIPRMISGAHWLSDITVGAASYALLIVVLALCTPLGAICCRNLEAGLLKIQTIAKKLTS
ncbi:MAG: phosphatase PAP2 family protein [Alphaproteobacteria bacterium]